MVFDLMRPGFYTIKPGWAELDYYAIINHAHPALMS
ncbi:hypothetical protein EYZ11_008916 [Aspergillus tanneri]|uniref:Uncharacterized protein n=1 Tax=Aspergillus tanneri TaxID=1220188 RepID=A0A4S3J9L1_9EURO|nr:hypothetical protein EYZ11_008916 [Aspergillus tanneri]